MYMKAKTHIGDIGLMENALTESDDNRVAHILRRELEHRERLDSCFLFPTFWVWGILGCRIKLLLFEEKVGLKFVESPFSPTDSISGCSRDYSD